MRNLTGNNRFCCILILCASLITGGCSYKNSWNDQPLLLTVTEEKVKQVDVIELIKAGKNTTGLKKTETELPELTLSIEECIAFALKNNLDLQVQLIEPTISEENIIQEKARAFEPAIRSNGISYSKTDSPTASSVDGSRIDTSNVDIGVEIPVSTGGTVTLGIRDNRYKTNSSYYTSSTTYNSDLYASIRQPLLKGRGSKIKTYNILIAQYNSRKTDAQTKKQVIATIATVGKSYWQLYAADKNLEVRKNDYELKKALFEQAKRYVEVGEKPRIELTNTRAGMASSRVQLLNAEDDLRDKERELKQILNIKDLGVESGTRLIPVTAPDLGQYNFDKEQMVKNAIENRMEMLEIEIDLAKDASNIEYQKNQMLPTADLTYRYNINGIGTSREDSYDVLDNNDYNDHSFSLNINIPIGNKEAKSRLREAFYRKAKNLAVKKQKRADIKKEILKQIDKVESAWERILAGREAAMYREEAYKEKKHRYELGLEKSTDLLQAGRDLVQEQQNEIDAVRDYQISLIDLAKAEGKLFSTAKVEWEAVVPETE